MVDFENLAVIPARGGSRRIPKKNIVDFFDKPLIAWTIEAAIQSNIFDKVIVSTDDQVIANIAIKYGAEVPFLRDNYADDYSTVSDVVCNEVSKLEEELKWKFQTVAQLMPNCPLRNKDDIISTFEFYKKKPNFSAISAFKYGFCNPWWAHKITNSGEVKPIFKHKLKSRSQDLERLLCPTGAIWLSSIKTLSQKNTFYSKGYRFFEIPFINAVDIDDYNDLAMAKALKIVREGSNK